MKIDNIQNQLIYSTVRIVATDGKEISVGTGFLVLRKISEDKGLLYIATNKHVVDDYQIGQFRFCATGKDGNPIDNQHIIVKINDLQQRCIYYPDDSVDLCFIDIMNEIEEARNAGHELFFRGITEELFINANLEQHMTAIEDVVMIGYPEGFCDEKNNKPVVRKGLTATSVDTDYNGKKEFMIDIACFHGSSGSPVFIETTGLGQKVNNESLTLGVKTSYCLAGIVHAMVIKNQNGDIKVKDVPTAKALYSETEIPLNLGHVIKAQRIRELMDIAFDQRNRTINTSNS